MDQRRKIGSDGRSSSVACPRSEAEGVHPSSTLVVGLGNPILGDDGVGWRVAEEVQRLIADGEWQIADSHQPSGIEVDCVSLGGLSLMERLVGYERAILIDAITTGKQPIGSVSQFPLEALPNRAAGHSGSAHDTSLMTALQMGRTMGARLPDDVTVVAIESQNTYDFSEELTPAVAAAVPEATRRVIEALGFPDPQYEINEED